MIGQIDSADVVATEKHPDKAHAFMAESVLGFTIELERIAEAIVMTMIGSVLMTLPGPLLTWGAASLAVVLFVAVRPLAVLVTLTGSRATHAQRRLMAWFGIRGIGSFYYLLFALEHGPPPRCARSRPRAGRRVGIGDRARDHRDAADELVSPAAASALTRA